MNKVINNEGGFSHLLVGLLAVVVIGLIGFTAWRVTAVHKPKTVNSTKSTPTTSQKPPSKTRIQASLLKKAAPTSSSASQTKPSSTPTTSSTASSNTSSSSSTTSSSSSSSSSTPSFTPPVPADYTDIGTIPAANLYDVKSPPPSNEQPSMTIYACLEPINTTDADLQFIGVLSNPVPNASSSNWYVDLDLSSSPSSDNIVTTKTTSYSYQNNVWTSTASGAYASNVAVTDIFQPGVVNDFYVWAYGSYGGSGLAAVNNHPNVTDLSTCPA